MTTAAVLPLHRRIKLRQLELLATLGEERSIHRVARRLGMTQPAASKLLREVEAILDTRLFERTRRGVVATSEGIALIARAKRLLRVLDGTQDELAAIRAGARGLVRAGVYAVAAPVLVPAAIAWLRSRDAKIRVRVEEGGPDALLGALRRGDLDCVVGRVLGDDDVSELEVEPLYPEPIVTAVRPGHRLAQVRRMDWRTAVSADWVLPHPSSPLRRMFGAWLARRGLPEPNPVAESVSILTNVTLIRDSEAMVMLPGGVAAHYAALGLIQVLPLPFTASLPPVSLLRRRGEPLDDATAMFSAALRAVRPQKSGARRQTRR
jgi:DNA-binding transcriptional LysR family regulator